MQAEHAVEEDFAVEIGIAETVGAGIEILFVLLRLEAEGIEIGMEVPAGAVSANQHQGADGIARRLLNFGTGELDAGGLRSCTDLVAERVAHLLPVAGESG